MYMYLKIMFYKDLVFFVIAFTHQPNMAESLLLVCVGGASKRTFGFQNGIWFLKQIPNYGARKQTSNILK